MSPVAESSSALRPLFTEEQLQQRIREMAEQINHRYVGCDKLIVIGVLKGSILFLCDLVKHLNMPCQLEFIRLSSYGDSTKSSGKVKPVDLTLPPLTGEHVLIVEDIVDTGLTMKFLLEYIRSIHQTESLELATLLDKPGARLPEAAAAFSPDYSGFSVGDEFVVGYGLDYQGLYRNLPYIGVFDTPPQ